MLLNGLVEIERVVKNKLEPLISEIEHVFSHDLENVNHQLEVLQSFKEDAKQSNLSA